MDFFEAQEHSRRLSRRLILLFGAAVVAMIVVVYFAVLFTMGTLTSVAWVSGWFQPGLLLAVAVAMLLVIGSGTAFRTAQLRRGGPAVAELLGGRRIHPDTGDPSERRLWNVVEEMSIASGIPVPSVYVMDHEPGINAFAAGHTIHDAAVAVTRGTLDALDRDELQGVVAHEFSHILNGDMRLNVRLMGLLFGILLLAVVGRGALRGSAFRGRSRRRGGGSQVALIGLILLLLGYLGVFFGRMIQAAISRQREFLADASAVQFTRNPSGIADALKKIGGTGTSRIANAHAAEAGHFFFADGTRGALSRAMATHPPLEDRIRRIEPRWDGDFMEGSEGPPSSLDELDGLAGAQGSEVDHPFPGEFGLPTLPVLMASLGRPEARHLAYARSLLDGLPPAIRAALREPEGAIAVVLALLVAEDGPPPAAWRTSIRESLGIDLADRMPELLPPIRTMGSEGRLPLLDLALPALRELSPARADTLRRLVPEFIRADGRVRSFEFALFHVLRRNLPSPEAAVSRTPNRTIPLARLRDEAETVLSAVARSSSSSEAEVQRAFESGTGQMPRGGWRLLPPGAATLEQVDAALGRLESARPSAKKALLTAAIAIVQADRKLEMEEVELLRAIAEAVDAPMPPIS